MGRQSPVVTEADIRKAFKVFDKYNDGKIKVDLLRSVLSKVGEPLSEKEFESFIQMMNLKLLQSALITLLVKSLVEFMSTTEKVGLLHLILMRGLMYQM